MARSGNGIDVAAVYQLLTEVAETVRGHSGRLDALDHKIDALDHKIDALDHKVDDLAFGLSDLRAAVTNYHGAVLGHGIMLSELGAPVRRIERHLKLEPADK